MNGITLKYDAVTSTYENKKRKRKYEHNENEKGDGATCGRSPSCSFVCFHPPPHLLTSPSPHHEAGERKACLLSWRIFFSTNVSMVTPPHSLSSASTFVSSHRLVSLSPPLVVSFLEIVIFVAACIHYFSPLLYPSGSSLSLHQLLWSNMVLVFRRQVVSASNRDRGD